MSYTIWSNGGKFEWIVYKGDGVLARSGLIYNSHGTAKRHFNKWLEANQNLVTEA